ncbi:RNA-directed DNA polymerase from mobile element jockey [Trichonephila clavipes]|nr:RNA-directed DNA polymerase from mobile element jockey [Trichonephila clavipes]
MEARKQQPQTSISAPVPPASTKPKPQPTAPQPAITRPTPKPHPEPEAAPQPSSPRPHKNPHSRNSANSSELIFNPLHRDKLHIVSWNADGIQHRIQELENYINDNSPDIIALQETNLRPCIDLNIPNYSTHRNDRLTHRGGGTAILVKNSIAHHVINIYTTAVNITAIEIEGPTNNTTREWDDALVECSHTNDSLHKLIARAKKKPVIYPPLLGFQGLVYGTREKADLFVDTLEDSFQENRTPYTHIDKVDRTEKFTKNSPKRIEKYTLDNSIIPDIQHGFRKETSTCHQLLRATNIIISGFNNHATTGGIFSRCGKSLRSSMAQRTHFQNDKSELPSLPDTYNIRLPP